MDMLDVRSARAMPDADFFLWRRGQGKKVGSPAPRRMREEWDALPEVEPGYIGSRAPRAWGRMNPEHHWGVRVKDSHRKRLPPELAEALMRKMHENRRALFESYSHGTTGLVNLRLNDLKKLYSGVIPEEKPKRLFNARVRRADQHGFAELDLREALRAALHE